MILLKSSRGETNEASTVTKREFLLENKHETMHLLLHTRKALAYSSCLYLTAFSLLEKWDPSRLQIRVCLASIDLYA